MSEKWIVREEYLSKLTALQNKKLLRLLLVCAAAASPPC